MRDASIERKYSQSNQIPKDFTFHQTQLDLGNCKEDSNLMLKSSIAPSVEVPE